MNKINLSFKSIFIGLAIAGVCTTSLALTGQHCVVGGYIKRVSQGWPHENNVIGITITDEYGNESNWSTKGSGDVNGHTWTRSLLAMALTAYTNQVFVFPTTAEGTCLSVFKGPDGREWHKNWEGLIYGSNRGVY